MSLFSLVTAPLRLATGIVGGALGLAGGIAGGALGLAAGVVGMAGAIAMAPFRAVGNFFDHETEPFSVHVPHFPHHQPQAMQPFYDSPSSPMRHFNTLGVSGAMPSYEAPAFETNFMPTIRSRPTNNGMGGMG